MTIPHIPVMKEEILSLFSNQKIDYFLDGTLGAGGHAEAILENHPEIKKYIGFDQDEAAILIAKERLKKFEDKLILHHTNFINSISFLEQDSIPKPDAIFLDLGVSSMQMDSETRGFSFRFDAPLDMRMDERNQITAEKILNTFSEKELSDIFFFYGEEKKARIAAKIIVKERQKKKITTTKELVEILTPVLGKPFFGKIHPLTLIFQALRIAVNQELDVLKQFLCTILNHLNPQGRMAVISFHSLEDKIVKDTFRDLCKKEKVNKWKEEMKTPPFHLLTKKPLLPNYKETKKNPRARSAKLRAIEKL